jgi:polyhydroxybutyrate depolymerase
LWTKYRVRIIAIVVVVVVIAIWISRSAASTRDETIPASYPSAGRELLLRVKPGVHTPRPLVIVLADELMSAKQIEKASGASSFADSHGFTVAYVDGVGQHWNPSSASPDPRFLVDVATYAATKTKIDKRRVYLWGLSEGGAEALRTACEAKPGVFAAVATIGSIGTTPAPCVQAANVNHQPGSAWSGSTDKTFWTFSRGHHL